jgi:hypothetical protein
LTIGIPELNGWKLSLKIPLVQRNAIIFLWIHTDFGVISDLTQALYYTQCRTSFPEHVLNRVN